MYTITLDRMAGDDEGREYTHIETREHHEFMGAVEIAKDMTRTIPPEPDTFIFVTSEKENGDVTLIFKASGGQWERAAWWK